MDSCSFSYGGCAVALHGIDQPYGRKLAMTVNAAPATRYLREAFAQGLLNGTAPKFTVRFEDGSILASDAA